MMGKGCNSCAKIVVYLLSTGNIIGGLVALYKCSEMEIIQISGAIVFMCLGFLLLHGALSRNTTCLLIYFVLMCIVTSMLSCFTGYLIITEDDYFVGISITFIILIEVLLWSMLCCVYIFYKELKSEKKLLHASGNASTTNFDETKAA